jgi:hypothetical protein
VVGDLITYQIMLPVNPILRFHSQIKVCSRQ